MLKRNNSFNSYTPKTLSEPSSLTRSKSFNVLPSYHELKLNINYNNPGLINGYIPTVKEVSITEGIAAANRIYQSILEDQWVSHIESINEMERETDKKRKKEMELKMAIELHKDRLETHEELWNMRCKTTYNYLIKLRRISDLNQRHGYSQKNNYFVCDINTVPIGIMLLNKDFDKKVLKEDKNNISLCCPIIHFIITHPGIQNCAYLLIEKAVNISYQMGYHGKVKLVIATKELSPKVYEKMGFIRVQEADNTIMLLNPNGNSAWSFLSNEDGYRFTKIRSIS
ncbi:hypothetical protein FE392_03105 [Xenorhabdus sp. 12]|uniref:N-acetyltransferase domain-containing protein n=1 Tax=Xenorhabdus santafensis TaxID=2582833 RepID=A0ABU4S5N3_9GAMM|nr:hypothetical protein [Xenorhabdus sp. 12]MDX7986326.1 hypothetical protein [Xenorhabdus sp. 12]